MAPLSGEELPDADVAPGWAWMFPEVQPFFSAELFGALVTAEDVQLGGDVFGRAPRFGFFSWSLAPWELLGPLALVPPRLAPAVPVPLTTGVAADAAFTLGAALRSPAFFTFFAFDEGLSPGLLAAPIPSDFMADAEKDVLISDTLLVRFTVGLSGAVEKHFAVFDCKRKKNTHRNQINEHKT